VSKNFVKLSVREISIDPAYQRSLDESRVDAMARHLDETRIGVPVLSLRKEGVYVVLDGQHRVEAMRRGGVAEHKILCEVHNGLSLAEEAALFLRLNNGRKPVRVFDKYRARMVAKETTAVEFTQIAQSLGLRIGAAPGKNTICAIQAIEFVHRKNDNLEPVLSILKKWGRGESSVFEGDLIKDVSRFLVDYSTEVDPVEFVDKLSRHDPGHIMRRIKGLVDVLDGNRRLAANSVFREVYNHRRAKRNQIGVEPVAQA
jgi:hypothetical protein